MEFHHLGYACRDLDAETGAFAQIGYRPEGADFEDARQGVEGRFLVGAGPRIELLAPLPGATILDPWLGRGVHFYHTAFLVGSLEAETQRLAAAGARVVSPPTSASAFAGRRISFLMLPNLALIELVESG